MTQFLGTLKEACLASGLHAPLGSSVWVIRPDWQKSLVQPVDASIACFLRIRSSSGFKA